MVVDDLGGAQQAEDPLPRQVAELAVVPAVPAATAVAGGTSGGMAAAAIIGGASARTTDTPAASDESSERVPLWNRLPRSIWLM
jgi:hypothetical protein